MESDVNIIDTHCHIEQPEFDEDRDSIIEKARSLKIAIISSAITPDTWNILMKIARSHPNVFASIGLDPMMHSYAERAFEYIRDYSSEIVAIGEVGLDHYRERNHAMRDTQESVFVKMIQLARNLDLPIQVHSRSAGRVALEVLERNEASQVHMHAFDGKASLARKASNDLGYYFSIPTSVVRSPQKQKLVKAVALNRLLLETDSPVLSPSRGERNVPTNISVALAEVSWILRRSEEEMREIILENTFRLYKRVR